MLKYIESTCEMTAREKLLDNKGNKVQIFEYCKENGTLAIQIEHMTLFEAETKDGKQVSHVVIVDAEGKRWSTGAERIYDELSDFKDAFSEVTVVFTIEKNNIGNDFVSWYIE